MSIVRKIISFILALLLYQYNTLAQENKVNFQDMWAIALDQNIQIQNADLLVEKSKSLKKTAWNFGELSFDFTRGQLNSELVDNLYTFNQDLGSPFTISTTKKFYASEQLFFENNANKSTKEIKKQLRGLYYSWLYQQQLVGILDSSISRYEKSVDFAHLQYINGETNLLSKALISSELQKLIIRKDLHLVNLNTIQNNIRILLNTDSIYIPVENELKKLNVIIPIENNPYLIDSVPEVTAKQLQVDVAKSYYKLTKSQISPSLSAGYFNLGIDQVTGYQGWQVGMSFPLWFMPQKARSQAAYIELSRAENQYSYEKIKAAREIESLLKKYDQMQKSILHFEEERLDNATLIDLNANLLYKSGSIGYIEFVANLSISRQIWEEYYYLINEYNQFIIELYYYLDY